MVAGRSAPFRISMHTPVWFARASRIVGKIASLIPLIFFFSFARFAFAFRSLTTYQPCLPTISFSLHLAETHRASDFTRKILSSRSFGGSIRVKSGTRTNERNDGYLDLVQTERNLYRNSKIIICVNLFEERWDSFSNRYANKLRKP